MIKNLPRFIKYTKDKQNHQKWVWKHLAWTMSFKTNWKIPFPPLPSRLSAGDKKKDWVPHRNSASSSIFCPTIHRGLSLSSGIKGHLLEAPPPPGPGFLSASTSSLPFRPSSTELSQLGFQSHEGVNLWMSSFPGGLEETHEGRTSCLTFPCTSWPQFFLVEGKDGREGKITNHTPLPETKISKHPTPPLQTLHSRWASDSFKLLLVCLHLNSLHASWICSPLLSNSSHLKPAPQITRCLLIPNQPTGFCRLTFSFALNRPVLPWVSTISSPLFLGSCSFCVFCTSLLSLLSLWISGLP